MPPPPSRRPPGHSRAFTIIELLTVIAIIGILAAILIPTLTGSQVSAKRAKTRVQFSQWATAIEGFRQEYGYYPLIPDNLVNGTTSATAAQIALFQELLSGRGKDASTTPATFISDEKNLTSGTPAAQNKKRITFISFGQGDLLDNKLQDAFGKTEIAVLVDKNQDGMIKIAASASGGDYVIADVPAIAGLAKPLADGDIVRAGVIFYSPGLGQSAGDIVKSWQ